MGQFRYLRITSDVTEVLEHVVMGTGENTEVCGLLGGFFQNVVVAVATVVHPLPNLSLLKGSFAVDIEEFCQQRDAIEKQGLATLALYHSHPKGLTRPSIRDFKIPRIIDLPSVILAWADGKLCFEGYDVDGRMLDITVITHTS